MSTFIWPIHGLRYAVKTDTKQTLCIVQVKEIYSLSYRFPFGEDERILGSSTKWIHWMTKWKYNSWLFLSQTKNAPTHYRLVLEILQTLTLSNTQHFYLCFAFSRTHSIRLYFVHVELWIIDYMNVFLNTCNHKMCIFYSLCMILIFWIFIISILNHL